MKEKNISDTKAAILMSRGVLRVEGPEARDFLQGLITNDMAKVTRHRALYAALLTPQGKFLFDFFVAEADGGFLLDCVAGRAADLLKRLAMYKLRAQVTLADVSEDYAVGALWGAWPEGLAPEQTAGAAAPDSGGVVFVDPRLAALGLRFLLPRGGAERRLADTGAQIVEERAYTRHRLGHGVPDSSTDIQADRAFLLECNFEELNGVDFRKGCYVGQEQTSRTKRRGTVRRRLVPVDVTGALPEAGTPVRAGAREVGSIMGGMDGRAIALLRLDRVSAALGQGLTLKADGAVLEPALPDWAGFSLDLAAEAAADEHGAAS